MPAKAQAQGSTLGTVTWRRSSTSAASGVGPTAEGAGDKEEAAIEAQREERERRQKVYGR